MAKTYIDTVKYLIYTNVEIGGLVEKPDVVGAIFGQTEGLLGDELDLRDLQKNGRIGRIEVDLGARSGKTTGIIKIPSSLDMVETCIIAAALETVDRVGPCEAKLRITKVEDTRNLKRKHLVDRAKNLLKNLLTTEIPESKEISQMVRDEVKTAEIVTYGPDRIPAGPGVDRSNEVILVEGRADVINLLKNDIANVAAIGGAKVTRTIVEISKKKEVTLFLDGDRGGDIILNELIHGGVEIDFIARAPTGTEVEELTRKEIIKYLRNRVPFEQGNGKSTTERRVEETPRFNRPIFVEESPKVVNRPAVVEETPRFNRPAVVEETPKVNKPIVAEKKEDVTRKSRQDRRARRAGKVEDSPAPAEKVTAEKPVAAPKVESAKLNKDDLMKELDALGNSLRARFYNSNLQLIKEVAVRDVIKSLGETKDINAIVFDGIITQRLADLASKQGVKVLVGLKIGNVHKVPENIEIISKNN
ncbi:DNA primase [Candidatus Micrarchaeota archaeon]|nr:DNA primase [Candidatus Micrarchaeota archaeon]